MFFDPGVRIPHLGERRRLEAGRFLQSSPCPGMQQLQRSTRDGQSQLAFFAVANVVRVLKIPAKQRPSPEGRPGQAHHQHRLIDHAVQLVFICGVVLCKQSCSICCGLCVRQTAGKVSQHALRRLNACLLPLGHGLLTVACARVLLLQRYPLVATHALPLDQAPKVQQQVLRCRYVEYDSSCSLQQRGCPLQR